MCVLQSWALAPLCVAQQGTRPETTTGGSTGSFLEQLSENKAETTSLLCFQGTEALRNSLTFREENEICRASLLWTIDRCRKRRRQWNPKSGVSLAVWYSFSLCVSGLLLRTNVCVIIWLFDIVNIFDSPLINLRSIYCIYTFTTNIILFCCSCSPDGKYRISEACVTHNATQHFGRCSTSTASSC